MCDLKDRKSQSRKTKIKILEVGAYCLVMRRLRVGSGNE